MKKLCVAMIFVCAILLSSCSTEAVQNKHPKTGSSSESASSKEEIKEIYSDKLISMSFVSVNDVQSVGGMFLLNIKATNNSDKKITIYLKDVSINEKMVQLGSGAPCDIMPSKEAAHSFTGKDSTVDISSADEIKKLEFKICVMNESSAVIETTKSITISL